MATTAEIKKATEHAADFKQLMKRTAEFNEKAAVVKERYARALETAIGHMAAVDKQGAELQAMMAEMGNAAAVMEETFQDDKPAPTPSKPTESAHLHEVTAGKSDAA